jgi:outer membrane murein-binding lipoprotein Lpp
VDVPATAPCILRSMPVPNTSEEKVQVVEENKQPEPAAPSSRKSILALSVFALGLNATAAVYTMPSFHITLPDFSGLVAELLPQERATAPKLDPIVVGLKDIQSAQQLQAASLQESSSILQRNTDLLQQDAAMFVGLRQSLTDERSDIKKISTQLSTLMAKVDSLQNAIAPEITSSVSKGRARNRLSGIAHKRIARSIKPAGPISLGGAPLTAAPAQSPEG